MCTPNKCLYILYIINKCVIIVITNWILYKYVITKL